MTEVRIRPVANGYIIDVPARHAPTDNDEIHVANSASEAWAVAWALMHGQPLPQGAPMAERVADLERKVKVLQIHNGWAP